jgi:hypothetical protein
MISDLDEALAQLLRTEVLRDQPAEIAMEAPTTDWVARQNGPVVDVFLYDIREDTSRRESGRDPVRNADGRVVAHRPRPRFMRLSYLITAWTTRPQDEHALLGQLLENLVRFDRIPEDLLTRRFAGETVDIAVATPPGPDRSLTDVWSALGGEMKPSLDLVLTAPLRPAREFVAGPPVQERIVRVGSH